MPVTRFAPSPTGLLHLGHAYAAMFAERAADGARFLLRIEDIDLARSKAEYEQAVYEDLQWLGVVWEHPVRRQSEHFSDYQNALEQLKQLGLLYPCFCTRKQIQQELARAGSAPHGPEGSIYPGLCKRLDKSWVEDRLASGADYALRLNVLELWRRVGGSLKWIDRGFGEFAADPRSLGDVVLARKETPTSYHLAVVVDDAAQQIELVTRGEDLLFATPLHRCLQAVLNLPVPEWQHHRLLMDCNGKRLAKRDDARALRIYRERGLSAEQVRDALWSGKEDSI